jgi:hypothetical protein
MEIIGAALLICFGISLYNFYMMGKILKAFVWILSHVHVVGPGNEKSPEFEKIRRAFGLEDPEEHGK